MALHPADFPTFEYDEDEAREGTYVLLPDLVEGGLMPVFADGSYCRGWVPSR